MVESGIVRTGSEKVKEVLLEFGRENVNSGEEQLGSKIEKSLELVSPIGAESSYIGRVPKDVLCGKGAKTGKCLLSSANGILDQRLFIGTTGIYESRALSGGQEKRTTGEMR